MRADRPLTPLLAVKYAVPPVRPAAVPRRRLEQRVQPAGTRMTVVIAPAGWGKTSLLSQWAADPGEDVRVAWLSLDSADDEPVRFWRYVLTALAAAGDDLSTAPLDALAAAGADPLDLALPTLLNELAAAARRYVLVLDDYHVLGDARIHEGVEFLVGYLPPSLRLVLATRADPPLPLARLRARGELAEVRAADLRFSVEEAAALVTAVSGTGLDAGAATALWERTEGWAAGLQLAGLALRGSAEPGAAARRLQDDQRHVLDYVAAEVLPSLDERQRDLLLRTAVLERLSGSLCDAALGTAGSAAVLEQLDRADLFVAPLDGAREWYRCHPLLRDALLRAAPASRDTAAVLARAADWFAAHDRLDDAAHHLLLAGEDAAAAALLDASSAWFFGRGAAATYLQLGERLPEERVSPQLALSLAYAAATGGRPDRVPHWLATGDRRVADGSVVAGWRDVRAAVLTMRAMIGTPDSEPGTAVDLIEEAAAREAAAGGAGNPIVGSALGSAYARDGRFAQAVPLLAEAWARRDSGAWSPGLSLQLAGRLGLALLALDRDEDVARLLDEALPRADTAEREWGAAAAPLAAALRLTEGRHRYRQGDLVASRDLLAGALARADGVAPPSLLVVGLVFLADAELACGDRGAARAALARARDVADGDPVAPFAHDWLAHAEARIGRAAVRSAARAGQLADPLTDRELSILRTLPGTGTQREIAAALFLSVNTVKAYTKSLYRKLGVASRADAVAAARGLGLI